MKKKVLAFTMAASMAVLAACGDGGDKTLVTSNVGNVTEQELYEELKTTFGQPVLEQTLLMKVLQDKFPVEDQEVEDAVNEQKEMFGDQFEMILQQQGMSEPMFKQNVRFQLLQQNLLDSIDVPEELVKEKLDRAKEEVHARHILVASEEEANDLIAQLDEGKDFAELAKEHSMDPGSKEKGGDLGWFGVGKMVAPFEDAAYELKKDEYTKEPVASEHGFHVIQLLDTRKAEEEVDEEAIKEQVQQTYAEQEAEAVLVDLLQEANFEMKDTSFEPVFSDILGNASESDDKDEKKEEKEDKKEKDEK
ncbi:foldase [Planococcaceae bacterium Storch 2/2-2]|nr:foldase [Planococcaceae bacterium Storch 2/2-2]